MVSDVLVTGSVAIVAGAVGYAVSGWVNLRSTKIQVAAQQEQLETRIQAENERQKADYFIERKVDELMHLYSVLEEARRLYKRRADAAPYSGISQEEYGELIEKFDEFSNALDRGMIFLDEDQQKTLHKVRNILMDSHHHLNRAIDNHESVDQYDFGEHGLGEFNDRFNEAEGILQEEVKGPIDTIESYRATKNGS